jgi:hypothetical protein
MLIKGAAEPHDRISSLISVSDSSARTTHVFWT